MSRYLRQLRVPGFGEPGQARLAEGGVAVPGADLAAEVAVRYLAGAGVGRLAVATPHLAAIAGGAFPPGSARAPQVTVSPALAERPLGADPDGPVAAGVAFALAALLSLVEGP